MNRYSRLAMVGVVAIMGLGGTGCASTPEGGETIVVRNGGPLDDKQIRQIVPNGSGMTWTGLMSEEHPYPASDSERNYKFDDTPDADAPPVEVPTADGVKVELRGTVYLNTGFDNSPEGEKLIRQFDTAYGTRRFGTADEEGDALHAWEEGGWSAYLNSFVKPVIDASIREVMAGTECKELVASCALVQRGGEVRASDVQSGSRMQEIEKEINEKIAARINSTLRAPYFRNIRFSLGRPALPGVQQAIDRAQSAFANVSEAQARVESAKQDRRANEEKQKGYNACSSCARQDELKALPDSLQTYAPGNGNVAVR